MLKKEPATEKQIAFLRKLGDYYGENYTKEKATKRITLLKDMEDRPSTSHMAKLHYLGVKKDVTLGNEKISEITYSYDYDDRLKDWERIKFIHYPDIFGRYLDDYLHDTLASSFLSSIKGKYRGAKEKPSKDKVNNTINVLSRIDPVWWHSDKYKDIFLKKFAQLYPDCVKKGVQKASKRSARSGASSRITQANKKRPNVITHFFSSLIKAALFVLFLIILFGFALTYFAS